MENSFEEFTKWYGGCAPLVFGTVDFNDDGHRWVKTQDDIVNKREGLYWCAWCGVHQVEVGDWSNNPWCPAVVYAKALDKKDQTKASEKKA